MWGVVITKKFKIGGMSCSACVASVTKAVSGIEGVGKADVNLVSGTMICEYNETITDEKQIITAVEEAGFICSAADNKAGKEKKKEKTQPNKFEPPSVRLTVSFIFLIPLMYITMGHMAGLPLPVFISGTRGAASNAFIQFLLVIPIVYVNRKFFYSGINALIRLNPNMDTLVSLGSSASLIYGIFAIFQINRGIAEANITLVENYHTKLYFESAAMILTLVTLGKLLEEISLKKTNNSLQSLLDLSPKYSSVIREGIEIKIPSDEIVIGDIIIIRPGDVVPVDGTVIEGFSSLDESALTGEAIPSEKSTGSFVMAASVNKNGSFKFKAEKVGSETIFAKIIDLVETAMTSKAPVSALADKIASVFVPAVLIISCLTAVLWIIFTREYEFAFSCAVSVLVISCPCALGLAVPVAVTVAVGRSSSMGVLIKSAEALQILSKVNKVVLDKTGTLTQGKPEVTQIYNFGFENENQLLSITASLEKKSGHPLSEAVLKKADNLILAELSDFKAIPGRGICGLVGGIRYFIGNEEYMKENNISFSNININEAYSFSDTLIFISDSEKLLGIITVADEIKEGSVKAVSEMVSSGYSVVMLTGDNEKTAEKIKDKIGITQAYSKLLPQDKEKIISDMQKNGQTVAMIGDGINDSPALTRADVGIAVGGGADIAAESADIVLMNGNLNSAAEILKYSKLVMRNIKQNLFWAFIYNIICIPIAAGLLYPFFSITLSPMIAAAAMSLSSVFVVTNALRLNKIKIR